MKKILALAIAMLLLVALTVNVLANETTYAFPVTDALNVFDGTISEGEYGHYAAYVTTARAYDDDSDDEIRGSNAYKRYQNLNDPLHPFQMDAYIYFGWDKDTLYFAADLSLVDGKFVGLNDGRFGEDDWNNDAVQWRCGLVEPTDDMTVPLDALWGDNTFNIIMTLATAELPDGFVTDGYVSSTNVEDNKVSACNHMEERGITRMDLLESGKFGGSIGIHGDRVHVEAFLKNTYWCAGTDRETLEAGDYFASSFCFFNTDVGDEKWEGMLTWGHGISGYNSFLGKTGTNKIICASAEDYANTDAPVIPTDVDPVITEPPTTEPPATEPSATEPPVTNPSTDTPGTQSPSTKAPVTDPTEPGDSPSDSTVIIIVAVCAVVVIAAVVAIVLATRKKK